MTRAFPRYLWKEWRDHRVVLAGIAIAVPALLVLARVLLPQKFVDDPILSQIGAWGSLAIATLALATDLVPGEARRGRLAFLARMPDGLRLAFRAKMAFLVLALAAAPVYGFVCGACLGGWHADGLEFVAGYALLLLCAAPWIFAISCWLPRGALALPATALVLALFALPFYLLHLAFPGYRPLVDDAIGAAVFLAAGALFVAWFSFTRGYRHGGTFLSAGWRGLAASAVLLLPAYAYGGYRVHEWTAVDPAAPEFFIKQVQAGEGDRYLFVNATMKLRGGRQKAHHALVVDAKDGSWRRAGVAFGTFEHGVAAARVVPLHDPASATRDERNPEWTKTWTHWYDGATGERFKSAWSNARPEEVDAVAFAHREPWERGHARIARRGLGWLAFTESGWRIADHVRNRMYASVRFPMVAPQGWILRRGDATVLRDPDTGAESPLAIRGKPIDVLPDGRVVVCEQQGVRLHDPRTNESVALDAGEFTVYGPAGLPGCYHASSGTILRLDGHRFEAVVTGVRTAALDEQRVIAVEEDRRIVRIDRATGERKVLFPR